jgi:uncharacterized membrane protein YraQ (UPF0718 family)
MESPSCCHHSSKRPWFKEPLYLVLLIMSGFLVLNFFLSLRGIKILEPVFTKFFGYLGKTWWAIGLGLLIGSLIEILVPGEVMSSWLGRGKKSIFLAVALGFFASACSHGILAIAISLYKKGASTAATLAFLLAAPWANLAITLLLFSLFGARAFLIIGGALVIALLAGFVFQILEEKEIIEGKNEGGDENSEPAKFFWPGWQKLGQEVIKSSWLLTKMVLWWILIGFGLASILGTYLPESFMNQYFGRTVGGLIATLALASIIEVCSEGSAPMAFELFEKTKAFGNAFVFLQAGVATDFTEIGLVWTNIGKRAAVALVLVTVPWVLIFGFLLNELVI